MSVFVAGIDSSICYDLSRRLAAICVGSRVEEEEKAPLTAGAHYEIVCSAFNMEPAEQLPQELQTNFYEYVGKNAETRDLMESIYLPDTMIPPFFVQRMFPNSDRGLLKQAIRESNVVIVDAISSINDLDFIISVLHEYAEESVSNPKTLVMVSSVLTWGRTKSNDDASLAEDEYRRRKQHVNYTKHSQFEKEWVMLNKKQCYKAYVFFSGLCYHVGDSIFHSMLKSAWLGEPVSIYGDGENYLPLIHLSDLCNVIIQVIETKPNLKYILAIDQTVAKYNEIAAAISTMGTGQVNSLSKEHAIFDLPQHFRDMFSLDLRMEAQEISKLIQLKYPNFLEIKAKFLEEYKKARGLTPLKLCLLGPPFSGKTTLCNKLHEYYKIPYLSIKTVMQQTIDKLKEKIEKKTEDMDMSAEQELLRELTEHEHYPEQHVTSFLKAKLNSMECQNQGYVLDGYPTIVEETNVFQEEETLDLNLVPNLIICLQVEEQQIKERAMKSMEQEEQLIKRLDEYKKTMENSVLNYFDENEFETIFVDDKKQELIMEELIKRIGKPHNYGPSLEVVEKLKKEKFEEEQRLINIAREEEKKNLMEEQERQQKQEREWQEKLMEVKKQEQQVLEAQSLPLRQYLLRNVMPSLTQALVEACKQRPEDPIDFIAEYLFKRTNLK